MKCFEIQFSELVNQSFCLNYQFHRLKREVKNLHNSLTAKVGNYCEILSGYAFSSSDYETEGVNLVRIGDFNDESGLSLDDAIFLPQNFEQKFSKFLLKTGDILIAMTGSKEGNSSVGKSAIVGNVDQNLLLNQRVGVLRAKNSEINNHFFSYLVKCDFFRKQVVLASMGKSQSNISPFDILNIKIPEISKSVQDQFTEVLLKDFFSTSIRRQHCSAC